MARAIVINGWLFSHLAGDGNGDSGSEESRAAMQFLVNINYSEDYLVVLRGEQTDGKIRAYCKRPFTNDMKLLKTQRYATGAIFSDDKKTVYLDEAPPLTKRLAKIVPRKDVFLVRTFLAVSDNGVIVTTDGDLITDLAGEADIKIVHINDFK